MVTVEEAATWSMQMPDAVQLPHFEKTSFRVKGKIFATLDLTGNKLVVKLSPVDQSAFWGYDPSKIYPVPNAWGRQGWTFIELKSVRKAICQDALKTAYQTVLKFKGRD